MALLIITFVVELLEYWLGLYTFFSMKLKVSIYMLLGFIVYPIVVLYFELNNNKAYLIMFSIVMIVLLVSMGKEEKQKGFKLFISVFVLSSTGEIFGIIFRHFSVFLGENVFFLDWEYALSSLFNILLLLLGLFFKQQYRKDRVDIKIKREIGSRMEILVIAIAMNISLTIGGLVYARRYITDEKFIAISSAISVVAFFSVGLLGVFIIYIKNVNQRMEHLAKTEKSLREKERLYYETLLKKEEDTRRYRHDITNHLIYINGLAEKEETEEIKNYVESMQNNINGIKSNIYITGNKILDIFINYYIQDLTNNVEIKVKGKCVKDLNINEMDMCIICSNLLQNAIQALTFGENKNEHLHKPYINVLINQGKDYFRMQISNTYTNEYDNSRRDKDKNHGLGLGNIRDAVERNGGKFIIKKDGNIFMAEVILNNR